MQRTGEVLLRRDGDVRYGGWGAGRADGEMEMEVDVEANSIHRRRLAPLPLPRDHLARNLIRAFHMG